MSVTDKQNVVMDKILELMSSKGTLSESKLRKFLDQFVIIDREAFKEHIVEPKNFENLDPRALCKFYLDAYCGISTELIRDTNTGYYKDAPGLKDMACELLVYELNKKEEKPKDKEKDAPIEKPVPTTPIPNAIPNDGYILIQSSPCDGCINNPKNKRDGTTIGDSPCQWCPRNPWTPKWK